MIIRKPNDIPSSEITPESAYLDRRRFLGTLVGGTLAAAMPGTLAAQQERDQEKPTPYDAVTGYNNYYEFGTGKEDPARYAQDFKTKPWTIRVEGEVAKPANYQLEDFLEPYAVEDRVYRHRCVEGWSMVIPWRGIQLSKIIEAAQPTPKAKFVEMTTLLDPTQMPGQRRPILDWPYVEGLRMDEAMHPLAIFATGLYGRDLPNQNGAPLRLVVPWKYGFKSVKSIVRLRLVERMPGTTWAIANPYEYGFYANVNPEVDRGGNQKTERRIGELFRRDTLMFNGYAEQVGSLYAGMDLRKYF